MFSAMDVDENASVLTERMAVRNGPETIFAKSDQVVVSFYATLPVEVRQALKTAGTQPSILGSAVFS